MKAFLLLSVLFFGCANVSTTRFIYSDPSGSKVTIEMPKEVTAKDLVVKIDAKKGSALITAASWASRNVQTISAQAKREANVSGAIAEGAAIGLVRGVKGL